MSGGGDAASVPKPAHLSAAYGAQFADPSVVAAYTHRMPYPPELFALLLDLIRDTPRVVLDAGCGRGEIARGLVGQVDRVDAVDPSAAMLAAGRTLPAGDSPHLRWIMGPLETAPLTPPYALAVAGSSLHWMEWIVVLPRIATALTLGGVLAVVNSDGPPPLWAADLPPIIRRYSTNQAFQPYDLLDELARRKLFAPQGRATVPPIPFSQPLADYIAAFHSMNGFSRRRMPAADAAAFDQAVADLVRPYCPDGLVHLAAGATVAWGRPAG